MRREVFVGFIAGLLMLLLVTPALAQDAGGTYGVGIFFDRNVPILGFDDRYPASQKLGVVLDYKLSDRTTLEFEYHHARLDDGKIEGKSFTWGIDKKKYQSPEADSEFNLNSFLINAVVRVGPVPEGETQLVPYVTIGGGFYDYQDKMSGLIYPGQKLEPLDQDQLLDPFVDDHTSLGVNLGVGTSVVQGRFGLDVRARYHLILGELRPMEAWGLESIYPISMLDVRTTFKFYFQ